MRYLKIRKKVACLYLWSVFNSLCSSSSAVIGNPFITDADLIKEGANFSQSVGRLILDDHNRRNTIPAVCIDQCHFLSLVPRQNTPYSMIMESEGGDEEYYVIDFQVVASQNQHDLLLLKTHADLSQAQPILLKAQSPLSLRCLSPTFAQIVADIFVVGYGSTSLRSVSLAKRAIKKSSLQSERGASGYPKLKAGMSVAFVDKLTLPSMFSVFADPREDGSFSRCKEGFQLSSILGPDDIGGLLVATLKSGARVLVGMAMSTVKIDSLSTIESLYGQKTYFLHIGQYADTIAGLLKNTCNEDKSVVEVIMSENDRSSQTNFKVDAGNCMTNPQNLPISVVQAFLDYSSKQEEKRIANPHRSSPPVGSPRVLRDAKTGSPIEIRKHSLGRLRVKFNNGFTIYRWPDQSLSFEYNCNKKMDEESVTYKFNDRDSVTIYPSLGYITCCKNEKQTRWCVFQYMKPYNEQLPRFDLMDNGSVKLSDK